jgi:hypothetical protein
MPHVLLLQTVNCNTKPPCLYCNRTSAHACHSYLAGDLTTTCIKAGHLKAAPRNTLSYSTILGEENECVALLSERPYNIPDSSACCSLRKELRRVKLRLQSQKTFKSRLPTQVGPWCRAPSVRVRVRVTLQLTVSQSVSHDQIFSLP